MTRLTIRPRAGVLALAFLFLATTAFADKYALTNVRIVNPTGAPIDGGLVSIDGDEITYAGPKMDPDEGATVIDCTGLTVYPGFIDAYSRSGLDLPSVPENAQAPSAVDGPLAAMWHENRRGIYADLDASKVLSVKSMIERAHVQGVTTAMLASGRGGFGGSTVIVNTTDAEDAQTMLAKAFQEISMGSAGAGGYPGSPMARIALLRQIMYDAQFYTLNPPQNGEALDPVLAAVAEATTGLVRTLFRADSEREIQRAFNLSDEFHLRTTLFGTSDAWQHAAELKRRGMGVIVAAGVPREPRKEQNEDPERQLSDPPLAVLEERWETWHDSALAVVKLHESGTRFAFSSEGGGEDFLGNVRKHIDLGLPADAALRALTSDAAEILGVADKVGTITAGRLANLVVMEGDFAEEASKVKFVFVAGTRYDMATEAKR